MQKRNRHPRGETPAGPNMFFEACALVVAWSSGGVADESSFFGEGSEQGARMTSRVLTNGFVRSVAVVGGTHGLWTFLCIKNASSIAPKTPPTERQLIIRS